MTEEQLTKKVRFLDIHLKAINLSEELLRPVEGKYTGKEVALALVYILKFYQDNFPQYLAMAYEAMEIKKLMDKEREEADAKRRAEEN